jgi:hypothetical protein
MKKSIKDGSVKLNGIILERLKSLSKSKLTIELVGFLCLKK